MARVVKDRDKRSNPANPRVFGEDLETLAWQAVGLGATAYVNDKVAAPVLRNVVPQSGEMMGKLLDAVTTGVSAWLVAEGVSLVDAGVGRNMKHGGMILAAGKGISVVIPQFSLSAQFPSLLPAPAPPPRALPSTNANGSLPRLGVGKMGL